MTISADWQVEIANGGNTLLMGSGTDYPISMMDGMGIHAVRTRDQMQVMKHGDVPGADHLQSRIFTITLDVWTGNPTTAGQDVYQTLMPAWRPIRSATTEATLDLRIPGLAETTLRGYVRPRGAHVVLQAPDGFLGVYKGIQCIAAFLDPVFYGAAVNTTVTSTQSVTNAGAEETDRCTIVLTGNGGTPTLTNNSYFGKAIRWSTAVGNTVVRNIDLRGQVVTDISGNDVTYELAASTRFFPLATGANSITLASATSAVFTHRPAYD